MTAEEIACNGGGGAQRAAVDPEKVVAGLEPVDPEKVGARIAAEEKEGEGVGGPFVIVNGDSDDHSERSLDLEGKEAWQSNTDVVVAEEAKVAASTDDKFVTVAEEEEEVASTDGKLAAVAEEVAASTDEKVVAEEVAASTNGKLAAVAEEVAASTDEKVVVEEVAARDVVEEVASSRGEKVVMEELAACTVAEEVPASRDERVIVEEVAAGVVAEKVSASRDEQVVMEEVAAGAVAGKVSASRDEQVVLEEVAAGVVVEKVSASRDEQVVVEQVAAGVVAEKVSASRDEQVVMEEVDAGIVVEKVSASAVMEEAAASTVTVALAASTDEQADEQVAADGIGEALEVSMPNGHDHAAETAEISVDSESTMNEREEAVTPVVAKPNVHDHGAETAHTAVDSESTMKGREEAVTPVVAKSNGHDHAAETANTTVDSGSKMNEREEAGTPVVAKPNGHDHVAEAAHNAVDLETNERDEAVTPVVAKANGHDHAAVTAQIAVGSESNKREEAVTPVVAKPNWYDHAAETAHIAVGSESAMNERREALTPVVAELELEQRSKEDNSLAKEIINGDSDSKERVGEGGEEDSEQIVQSTAELLKNCISSEPEHLIVSAVAQVVELKAEEPLNLNSVGEVGEKDVIKPVSLKEEENKDDSKIEQKQGSESESQIVDDVQLELTEVAVSTMQKELRSSDLVGVDKVDEHSSALVFEEYAQVEENQALDRIIESSAEAEPIATREDEFIVAAEVEPCIALKASVDHVHDLHSETVDTGSSENVVDLASSQAELGVSSTSISPENVSLQVVNTASPIHEPETGHSDSSAINGPNSSQIDEACHSDGDQGSSTEAPCLIDETCRSEGTAEENCLENANCSENVNAVTTSLLEVETKESLSKHKDNAELLHQDEIKITQDSSQSHSELDKGVLRQQKIFIVKVPRFASEDLWEKIQEAQVHLDKLTQHRDSINVMKQRQKAVCDEYREKLEAARTEERAARAAHGDKKHDLTSVQSMIGKLNKANSIEEIDEMIAMKNRIIQHETIALKEEKILIQEIKELKAQRKQLYCNIGSKAEIDEAFHQKEHIHERHKTLKKDSDVLLNNLKSLEERTRAIQKTYDDERAVLRKLNEEYRAANELRQKAYDDWFGLKMEPGKKSKFFFMYKKDRNTVSEYLSLNDIEGLQLYCNNQVEKSLEIWNKNEDFRRQYVEANKNSTLRRLGTSDGRRLGPNDDPPVITSNFNRRPSNPSPLPVSSPHVPIVASEVTPEDSVPDAAPIKEDSFPVLQGPQNSKHAKSKVSGSSSPKEMPVLPSSGREELEHTEKEKARQMEEELELARNAEDLACKDEEFRKEKAAAEKERLRLEQKAKAKEAEERKKRKAEKAQERAELKARKEAESKEKKKAKKDKRKGTTLSDSASGSGEGNAAAIASTGTESSTAESSREADVPRQTASKRPSRPAAAVKQLNRGVQPVPLPLRNRGRRKMRSWILAALAVLSVLALFVAGNHISFSRISSLKF